MRNSINAIAMNANFANLSISAKEAGIDARVDLVTAYKRPFASRLLAKRGMSMLRLEWQMLYEHLQPSVAPVCRGGVQPGCRQHVRTCGTTGTGTTQTEFLGGIHS